ncbi:MAG: zinc-ribbon and DUF3426 domain-containing protein [Rhodanobacteraceae bacterium]
MAYNRGMYTQCPECLTVYAIDEDALQTSLGIVRCGRCDKRFDALRTLSDTLPIEPLAPPEQPPDDPAPTLTEAVPPAAFESALRKSRRKTPPEPERPAPAAGMQAGSADDWFADIESELDTEPKVSDGDAPPLEAGIENWRLDFPSESGTPETSAEIPDAATAGESYETLPDAESGIPAEPGDEAPWLFEAPDEPAAVPETASEEQDLAVHQDESGDDPENQGTVEAVAKAAPKAATNDGESDAATAPAPVYVRPRRRVSRASVAWALGCVLLALLLAAQLAWADRIELVRNPAAQPWMARLCGTLACNLPLIKDTAKLELLSRDVRPDPNAPGALTITATMRNDASFSQPWPVVVVQLTDLDNAPVAMRRFRPPEYMTDPAKRAAGIAPGATAVVAFEVADPGKRAVAFQFGFE